METEGEAEKALDEFSRGGISKTLSMFFKKVSAIHYDASVIMINQLRDNMNMANMYSKTYVIPGGRALKHGNALTLVLSSGEKHKETINKKEVMYGKDINFIVDKGKAGCHDGGKGSYTFYNGALGRPFGFDTSQDLLICGVFYGLIEQSGAWFSYKNERLGCGKDAAAEALKAQPELCEVIRKDIFDKANVKFVTR
jgi:recombination protein RecA